MQVGETLGLICADLDDEGAGVGAADGTRIHVAGALPGERVAAVVEHVSPHARRAWARLATVEAPSAARVSPVCPAFGACGGCRLQHLAYPDQLAWKRDRVARAFAAHPPLANLPIDPCVASPRPLGYRNKSKLVVGRAEDRPDGRLILGAYAPRTHDLVDLAGCRITEPPLDETAAALRALVEGSGIRPYDERALTGDLRHVVLRANHAGRVLAVWVVARPLANGAELARSFRAARPEVMGVVEHENRTRGNAILSEGGPTGERILDGDGEIEEEVSVNGRIVRLKLSAGAFFQANRAVAGLAYAALERTLAVTAGERAVDAYCGVGGIALTLARSAREVVGIESHAGAVADATASAARNEIRNARFLAGDAAQSLAEIDGADVVVLNPPRKGCAPAVLTQIARLAPRAIAYLSCDPDTLARDLAVLASHGHRPTAVTPFDMLPHTPHVETLAILARTIN